MKKKGNIFSQLTVPTLCLGFLLAACDPAPIDMVWDYELAEQVGKQNTKGTTPVLLSFDIPEIDAVPETKSRLSESTCSGYVLVIYEEGVLNQTLPFTGSTSTIQVSLKEGFSYKLAIMRNMWRVNTGTGDFEPLEAPALASDLPTMVYRVDGAAAGSGYRYPTYAETVAKGIPAAGSTDISVVANPTLDPAVNRVNVELKPLFAKISLTIDQSAIEGSTDHGYLTGSSVYVRGVNASVAPFGTGSKASSTTILAESDYDNPLDEGAGTYTFFAPENMQGTDGTVTDANNKVPSLKSDLATYLEYNATVNSGAGISGDVVYKFCLGANATTDFNVERGKKYDVTLTFNVNSLLGEGPVWKIDASSVTDSREFFLSKDGTVASAFEATTVPADMQVVVVRLSRKNVVYPIVDVSGATSSLPGEIVPQATVTAHGVTVPDIATSKAVFVKEEMDDLKNTYGIKASYDGTNGKMTFELCDAAKFAAHIGQEKIISAYIAPGYTRRMFKVRLMGDISMSVSDGLSLESGFYIGMSRTITVSNVFGATQNGTFTTKDGTTSGLSFNPAVNLTAGTYEAIKGTAETYSTCDLSSPVKLYAMARNASDSDKNTDIKITFEDSYNNPPLEFTTQVVKPKFRIASGVTSRTYSLPVEGGVKLLEHGWFNNSGAELSPTSGVAANKLDSDLYKNIMEWFNSPQDLYYTATYPKWKGTYPGDNDRAGVLAAGQFLSVTSNPNPDKPAGKHKPAVSYDKLQYLDNGTASGWLKPGNRLAAFIGSYMNDVSKATMADGTALGTRTINPFWTSLQGDGNSVTYTFTAGAPVVDPSKHFAGEIHYEDWFDQNRIRWDDTAKKADCDSMVNSISSFKTGGNVYFDWVMNDPIETSETANSYYDFANVYVSAPDASGNSSLTWSFKPLRYKQSEDRYYALVDCAPIGSIYIYAELKNIHSGESFGTVEDGGKRYVIADDFKSQYLVHLAQHVDYQSFTTEAYVYIGNPFYIEFDYLRRDYPDFDAKVVFDDNGMLVFNEEELRIEGNAVNGSSGSPRFFHNNNDGSSSAIGHPDGMPGRLSTDPSTWTYEFIQKARAASPVPYPYAIATVISAGTASTYVDPIPYSFNKWYNSGLTEYLSITTTTTSGTKTPRVISRYLVDGDLH